MSIEHDEVVDDSWSISIKTVGSEQQHNATNSDSSAIVERDFTVNVSPEDDLASLYDQIECVTGLKASQQRLIYRGRLIGGSPTNNSNNGGAATSPTVAATAAARSPEAIQSVIDEEEKDRKIKDITGLGDGQTIHLVRRRDCAVAEGNDNGRSNNNNNGNAAGNGGATNNNNNDSDNNVVSGSSMTGLGSSSLLAALLGLGSGDDEETAAAAASNSDNNNNEPAGGGGGRRWRSPRYSPRRRAHYRLTSEDLEVADPGSMEPVRQGMMTLHTLLPNASRRAVGINGGENNNSGGGGVAATAEEQQQQQRQQQSSSYSPLDANRRWYRGQWMDCRDTVNQWLEATVVDIVYPEDILPRRSSSVAGGNSSRARNNGPTYHPATDPAVSSGDLEGRRRLLLEPCERGDDDDEGGELAGYRRRDNNAGVQLLLIHYNGWPHRWDEWIRSDSERIRPFRVRTRHPSMASHSSPTPQSVFTESPSTNIRNDSEARDRAALLPELGRVVTAVNDVLADVVAASEQRQQQPGAAAPGSLDRGTSSRSDLPWSARRETTTNSDDDELEDLPLYTSAASAPPESGGSAAGTTAARNAGTNATNGTGVHRRDLEALAPLLDRLGRTLVDAAPHVAALASSMPRQGSLNDDDNAPPLERVEEHPSTLGGLLSLLSRDRRSRQSLGSTQGHGDSNASSGDQASGASGGGDADSVDPDYVDFAGGVVNTSRGEVRSGPRSRSQGGGDDVAGLLGAYLAAASLGGGGSSGGDGGGETADDNGNNNNAGLGRLLRERGNGGGGIDIHIHAVVTAPGMVGGGLGLATLGAGTGGGGGGGATAPAATSNLLAQARERRSSPNLLRLRSPTVLPEDDDMGIFSELYSENPDPVNPNRSPDSAGSGSSGGSSSTRSLHAHHGSSGGADDYRMSSSSRAHSYSGSGRGSRSSPRRRHRDRGSGDRDRGDSSSRRSPMFSRWFRRGSSSGGGGAGGAGDA